VRRESAHAMDFCDLYILTKVKLENILSVLHGQVRPIYIYIYIYMYIYMYICVCV
jgi:hypothetical protein